MGVPARKPRKSTRRTPSVKHELFVSHSSKDDAFVGELQRALGDQGVRAWIDSRDLLPGGLLAPDIKKAIDGARAFAIVVSPDALQSRWVGKEIGYALEIQKKRGRGKFPVIPLSLDGTKLGVLEELFRTEPTYIPVSSAAGGAEAAVHPISSR
jgi:TIR domain